MPRLLLGTADPGPPVAQQQHRTPGHGYIRATGTQRPGECRIRSGHFPWIRHSGILPNTGKPLKIMNYFKRVSILSTPLLLLTALGLTLQASAQTREIETQGQLLDRVAAVVNDGVVLQSEVDEKLAAVKDNLRSKGQQMPPDAVIRQQILESLIVQEAEQQRADRAGIKVSDETLNNAMTEVAQRNGITLQQLPQALAVQGIDYGGYRDSLRRELTLRLLQERDVAARIVVTPREIDQYLERQARHPSAKAEYNVS